MPRYLIQLTAFIIMLGISGMSYAAGFGETSAKQAILVDYETGMVLFKKNADQQMPTSSMSKVMSIYLVFEALKNEQLTLETQLSVSEKAWRKGGSKMFVEVGKQVKVEDLIRGVVIQSGNDATIVLAEGLSGSEDVFAENLNAKAAELGMKSSHFMNASGWPDPDHYSTATDLATLAINMIRNFPDYYHYYAETEFSYNNIKQSNRNPLLYRNIGADGIKTGHTEVGGYGLMGSGKRNGRRVVLVMNGLKNDKARAQEGARLLEWGLKGFENIALFAAGETVEYAEIIMGKTDLVPLVLENAVTVTVPAFVKNDLKVEAIYDSPLLAPIKKGQQVGVLKITVPRVKTFELPLFAAENVDALGFFAGTFSKMKRSISGKK